MEKKDASKQPTPPAAASNKSKRGSHRTLAALLKYFQDVPLRVELKNGRTYRGTLESADLHMSLTLTDVVQHYPPPSSAQNETCILPLMQIRGSTIRYIHFPDHLDLAAVVKAGIQREKEAVDKYKRGVRKGPKTAPP